MAFYVYGLWLEGEYRAPFYVGKSVDPKSRFRAHLFCARSGEGGPQYDRIREIWDDDGQVSMRVIAEFEKENDAYACEKLCIRQWRKQGLSNLTNGGPGPAGLKRTDGQIAVFLEATYPRRQWLREHGGMGIEKAIVAEREGPMPLLRAAHLEIEASLGDGGEYVRPENCWLWDEGYIEEPEEMSYDERLMHGDLSA